VAAAITVLGSCCALSGCPAAAQAGWDTPCAAGRFRGIAVAESFGSFVAQVAEVSVTEGQVRVHRVTCAIDCGLVVNPDTVRAQMESCIVYGLTATQNVVFQRDVVVDGNVVLNLDVVADNDAVAYKEILTKAAMFPDDRAAANVHPVPDSAARANAGADIDDCALVCLVVRHGMAQY